MWDYSISAGEMEELLGGKIDKAGHYTREKLFAKMLIGLPWYTIIQLVPVEKVKEMLTDKVIGVLWPKSIQKKYEYVKKRLQEALPDAGWGASGSETGFVNNIVYRCGVPNKYLYGFIDTPLNILTNKLTAVVSRDEPKDVFDICVLSQNYRFNWVEVFNEAKNKAIINEIDVEQRIKSFPVLLLQKADWHILSVDIDLLAKAIVTIANDFLLGSDNSLGADKPPIQDAIVLNPW